MGKKILWGFLYLLVTVVSVALIVLNLFYVPEPDYGRVIKSSLLLLWVVYCVFMKDKPYSPKTRKEFQERYKDTLDGLFINDKKAYNKFLQTLIYYDKNKYRDARKQLERMVNLCTNNKEFAAVYLYLGLCFSEENKVEESLISYEKSLKHDMTQWAVWNNIALKYYEMENYQEAYKYFQEALRYNANDDTIYYNMSRLLLDVNEPEGALAFAMKTLELNSKNAEAMAVVAISSKMLGDDENAEKYCRMYGLNGEDAKELREVLQTVPRWEPEEEFEEDEED